MSDEQAETTPAKRGPGQPKGSTKQRNAERGPVHRGRGPVHQGRSGDDDVQDPLGSFEYKPYEQENPLAIDGDIVRSIEREWGYSLLWVCYEVNGKPFPNLVSARKRNGFGEVKRGNFGGALDHMCDRDGRIVREGLVLMGRDARIQRIAKAHDDKLAKSAVAQMRASHEVEGVNVTMPGGGDHPSALKHNTHKQTFEPGPQIPD